MVVLTVQASVGWAGRGRTCTHWTYSPSCWFSSPPPSSWHTMMLGEADPGDFGSWSLVPTRPARRQVDSSARAGQRIKGNPGTVKSQWTCTNAYSSWMDEQWRKRHGVDVEMNGGSEEKKHAVVRSERLKMFRRKHEEALAQQKALSQQQAAPTHVVQPGLIQVPAPPKSAKQVLKEYAPVKSFDTTSISLEPEVYNAGSFNHTSWMKQEQVDMLGLYPILSPRAIEKVETSEKEEPGMSDNSFIQDALLVQAIQTAESDVSKLKVPAVDVKRLELKVQEMAKRLSSSCEQALVEQKKKFDMKLKDIKLEQERDMEMLKAAYDERLSYHIRRTQHMQQAENAVRELVEINSRIIRGGKGNKNIPGHLLRNMEMWNRRNQSVFQEQPASRPEGLPMYDDNAYIKPWTPRLSGVASDKLNQGRRGSDRSLETMDSSQQETSSQFVMLEALRKQNEDIRQSEEAMCIQHERAKVSLAAKDEELKAAGKRYRDLEAKYKNAIKDLKLLEYQYNVGGKGGVYNRSFRR